MLSPPSPCCFVHHKVLRRQHCRQITFVRYCGSAGTEKAMIDRMLWTRRRRSMFSLESRLVHHARVWLMRIFFINGQHIKPVSHFALDHERTHQATGGTDKQRYAT
mmetsp:Transcript_99673/g.192529  ORF Transcript_99673/g.192529 Transcript_99673/m.192529 type:complete len:106 (+) Transcript_99673:46-363(+)